MCDTEYTVATLPTTLEDALKLIERQAESLEQQAEALEQLKSENADLKHRLDQLARH